MTRTLFRSPRFHYTFDRHLPTLHIEPPAAVRVICPDSDNVLADGSALPPEARQPGVPEHEQGNPLAGPIHVSGAARGDCIAVHIEHIHLDRREGQTGLAPRHGLIDQDCAPCHLYRWDIDLAAGEARLCNPLGDTPIRVPLDPFVGCIATAPEFATVRTLFSGNFGGNLDLPMIKPGATVLLPVYHDGGLVMLGDVHAAQGHGEMIGGGIETSGTIDCTIELIRGNPIGSPRIIDRAFLTAVAVEHDLHHAVRRACEHLVDWISLERRLNRWDVYNLVSQTGSIVMGNLLAAPFPVAARVPLAVLPGSAQ